MIRLCKTASATCGNGVQGIQSKLFECPSAVLGDVRTRIMVQKRIRCTAPPRTSATNGTVSEWLVANPRLEEKLNYVTKLYEDFIGLTEVKAAQAKVGV